MAAEVRLLGEGEVRFSTRRILAVGGALLGGASR
jgi:hypothetical protein